MDAACRRTSRRRQGDRYIGEIVDFLRLDAAIEANDVSRAWGQPEASRHYRTAMVKAAESGNHALQKGSTNNLQVSHLVAVTKIHTTCLLRLYCMNVSVNHISIWQPSCW